MSGGAGTTNYSLDLPLSLQAALIPKHSFQIQDALAPLNKLIAPKKSIQKY